MNAGLSGFYNAPASKGVFCATAALSLLAGMTKARDLGLRRTVFRNLELWRFVSSNFVFSGAGEAVVGLILLYYFRVFERQKGSSKYGAFLFISTCISTTLQLVWLMAIQSDRQVLASGPSAIIFSCFVQFWYDVPGSSYFSIFGVKLSDKFFVYLFGAQLLFSSYGSSLVPALCGIAAGLLYRRNVFGLRNFKFPEKLNELVSRTIGALCASQRPHTLANSSTPRPGTAAVNSGDAGEGPPTQTTQGYQDQMLPRFGGWGEVPPSQPSAGSFGGPRSSFGGAGSLGSSVPPSPEAVEALVAMGFDRDSALQALAEGHNDVNVATHLLLSGGRL